MLYLHGIDYMSTGNLYRYFGQKANIEKIYWLNDSSAKIHFKSDEDAMRSFRNILMNISAFENDQQGASSLLMFREAFEFRGVNRMDCKIEVRFATDKDVKDEATKAENSRYYKIIKQKQDKKKDRITKAISKRTKRRRNSGSDSSSGLDNGDGETSDQGDAHDVERDQEVEVDGEKHTAGILKEDDAPVPTMDKP
jgi:hypothetical protein